MYFKRNVIPFVLLFLAGSFLAFLLKDKPVGDFGNYYYGSKIFTGENNALLLYKDVHWFNSLAVNYGASNFFGNYIPVPPISLIVYVPFTYLPVSSAKLIFSIISILIFAVSFYRFSRAINASTVSILVVMLTLSVPIYNNIVQGQAYLLITAAILEIYLAFTSRKFHVVAILIAIIFHLKIAPVFILLFFLIKREFRIVLYSILCIVIFSGLIIAFTGMEIFANYFIDIVPRFFKNEIVAPFFVGHQSVDILLKNLFCFDSISNPSPVIASQTGYILTKVIFIGLFFYFLCNSARKQTDLKVYGYTLFIMIISSGYITGYSLIMLLPFVFVKMFDKTRWFVIPVLFLAVSVPAVYFSDQILPLKYFRVFLMLVIFGLIVYKEGLKWNKWVFGCVLAICTTVIFLFKNNVGDEYFSKQAINGVPYGITWDEKSINLNVCRGSKDTTQVLISRTQIRKLDKYKIKGEPRGVIVNDSLVLFLSDLNQGVGLYKVRKLLLKR